MDEKLLTEIKELIKEAEEIGERASHVEHYKVMLGYYVACLETLYFDIFNANQQTALRNQRNKP